MPGYWHGYRYATVVLESERSSRILLDRLSKKELHGQIPIVKYFSRQALQQFDTTLRKEDQPSQQQQSNGSDSGMISISFSASRRTLSQINIINSEYDET